MATMLAAQTSSHTCMKHWRPLRPRRSINATRPQHHTRNVQEHINRWNHRRLETTLQVVAESTSLPEVDDTEDDSTPSPSHRWTDVDASAGLRDRQGRLQIKNMTIKELEQWCVDIGEQPKRAMQLWRWMYADDCWIKDLKQATNCVNGFGAAFAHKFESIGTVDGGLELQDVVTSKDGTRKLLFKLTTGKAAGGTVETVLIPVVREAGSKRRITVCVSSQVGCAMNCQFCYTGRMGLLGNLNTAQIVEQLVYARRVLAEANDTTPVTNVVFMGMGEPLHNMDSVMRAAEIMSHYLGLHMSHNKITVSTVGLAPEMRHFLTNSRSQLALSLHATTDEVRDWIVPVNNRYPLAQVLGVLRELVSLNNAEGRHVLIEYTMLHGVNDTLEDAARLVELLKDIECKVNLIVFNPFNGTRFKSSEPKAIKAFRSVLIQAGRVCTIRDSRGDDEMAACGQLGNPQLSSKNAPILPPPPQFEPFLAPSC